jgi:assimilatory nitrate reductase catalytic subunit
MGMLCDRGLALEGDAGLENRLLHPQIGHHRTNWDRAIAHIARRLSAILSRHGPGSIALHVGGGLLTEDYYAANKLLKGFCGSAHIHAPWRGTTSAVQRAAFGEDVMPAAMEDLDHADLIILAGAGAALDHPILLDRVMAARAEGSRLVVIDQDGSARNLKADLYLPIPADGISALFAGLLARCRDVGALDADYLARAVATPSGFWDGIGPGHDVWSVARACGLAPTAIRAFHDLWFSSTGAVTLFGDGDTALGSAILNLHLATGRIGRPGATPFALPGAANAMGAREVGCLPDDLAAHAGFASDARARVARFWGARSLAQEPGLEGDALLDAMRDGRIRALWSMGADPAANEWLAQARSIVPLSIRSTDRLDEREDGWHVLLPSAAWLEKDGTLTNCDRLISRHRRLLPIAGEAHSDWWIVNRVAQTMGWGDAFSFQRPADIFREHVRLTAYAGDGLLDLRRHAPISNPAYDELTPWRWGGRPFAEGRFPTQDGRACLC